MDIRGSLRPFRRRSRHHIIHNTWRSEIIVFCFLFYYENVLQKFCLTVTIPSETESGSDATMDDITLNTLLPPLSV